MTDHTPRIIEGGVAAKANPATAGNKPRPLVEDTTVVGGVDRETGAPVIRPKTPEGHADAQTEATDPREQ